LPIKMIARVLGVSRNTVRAAIASDGPPKYERKPAGSIVDVVEPRIRGLFQTYPTMPATVIAERIGWTRSIRVLSGRVAELRPVYLPPDPASRTSYELGEIAQCDMWFPPISLPVGFGQARNPTQLPVLTMVTGYSRWLSPALIPTRTAADLFAGWCQLISGLGAVPRQARWRNALEGNRLAPDPATCPNESRVTFNRSDLEGSASRRHGPTVGATPPDGPSRRHPRARSTPFIPCFSWNAL
jgi:hypothetical protein